LLEVKGGDVKGSCRICKHPDGFLKVVGRECP
jgi:hypothetical protein